MKLLKEKRAQGTLEYIVIIAGAILVATVIALALKEAGKQLVTTAGPATTKASQ